jgi:hypothetical protein
MSGSGMDRRRFPMADDISSTMCSSPNLDCVDDKAERLFSFEMAGGLRTRAESFAWDSPLDYFDDLVSLPAVRSDAPEIPRRRDPAVRSPNRIVLKPFESCLSVELAVKVLRSSFSDKSD